MHVCDATGPVLGLEMVVVLVVMVLEGIISGRMKGGLDGGMDEKGGAGYPRGSSKEDRMRETRRERKKKEDIACLPFFFPRPV